MPEDIARDVRVDGMGGDVCTGADPFRILGRWPGKVLTVITAGVLLLVVSAAGARADKVPTKPALSIAGSDALEIVVSETHPDWKGWTGDLQGDLRVTLYNSGPKAVQPHFSLAPSGTKEDCPDDGFALGSTAPAEGVPPRGNLTYDLLIKPLDRDCVGVAATLLVTGSPRIETVTASVKTKRDIGWWEFGPPLGVALVAFLVVVVAALASCRGRWQRRTPTGDSWSFSGSWLTSVSAVATALAGVLAASGFVGELLPGVPIGNFLGLSLTFTGLIIAAPLVFSIFQVTDWEVKDDPSGAKHADGTPKKVKVPVLRGRLVGLFVGGALTCGGVSGLLTMLAVLTGLSSADKYSKLVVAVLLVLVLLTVAVYSARSMYNTVTASGDPPADAPTRAQLEAAVLTIEPAVSADSYRGFTGAL